MDKNPINLQYTTIKDPLPEFIYQGLVNFSRNANSYKPQPIELVEKLAQKHGVLPEMIFLTAGIDEAIQIFAKSYGQNTFVFTPTYTVYADVQEFGGKLTCIPSVDGSEYAISPDKIEDATLIFLANPNNPSGVTSKQNVLSLVRNNSQAKVVIDEAYGEFADLSVIDQVKNYPHMAVMRSFSKAYSMAGNRLGYVIANPDIIQVIKNKTQWANVSYLSVGAALAAMDHEDHFISLRQDINNRRDEFVSFLSNHGFSVFPSKINAVLIKFPTESDGSRFVNHLNDNNVTASHGNGNSNIGLDKSYVRIAIGNADQMETLKEIILTYQY